MWSKLVIFCVAIFVHFGNCLDELNRKDIWNPYNADIQKKGNIVFYISSMQIIFNRHIYDFLQLRVFYILALQSEMTNEVAANEDIKDKEAFFRLFNMILWSQSDDDR